jgi:hypothetical protein
LKHFFAAQALRPCANHGGRGDSFLFRADHAQDAFHVAAEKRTCRFSAGILATSIEKEMKWQQPTSR